MEPFDRFGSARDETVAAVEHGDGPGGRESLPINDSSDDGSLHNGRQNVLRLAVTQDGHAHGEQRPIEDAARDDIADGRTCGLCRFKHARLGPAS